MFVSQGCRRSVVFLAVALLLFPAAVLTAAQDPKASPAPRLGDSRLSIALDAATGSLTELAVDGRVLTVAAGDAAAFNIRQEKTWIVDGRKGLPRLLRFERSDDFHATATVAVGDWEWELQVRYTLDPAWPILARSFKLTWKGSAATKLKGFWAATPPLPAGAETNYFFPGVYPPRLYTAADAQAGGEQSTHQSLAPLVVQLSPQRSLLWISDELLPVADHGSATVRHQADTLRVTQGINALAIMKPGESQELGTTYVGLVAGDGQRALRRIPDWMRAHGHVPADRPAWSTQKSKWAPRVSNYSGRILAFSAEAKTGFYRRFRPCIALVSNVGFGQSLSGWPKAPFASQGR